MVPFTAIQPSVPDHWRAVILLGRNVAAYKFALGRSLLELASQQKQFVTLDELAVPFARHICSHLQASDKQATSRSSRFLDACRKFCRKEIAEDELHATTVKYGFENVIDAFHVVGAGEIGVRFFLDERKGSRKGIQLTDTLLGMREHVQQPNLPHEIEARWRLVETAWSVQLPIGVLKVSFDPVDGMLVTQDQSLRRIAITRVRPALNGYQKGKCFYCFENIDIASVDGGTDVDHVLPHLLKGSGAVPNIDGVWNLVLACARCNRGEAGKFASLPELQYLERLSRRNEFLISSHHPLRETLMHQTGATVEARRDFLQTSYNRALRLLIHTWRAREELDAAF